MGPTGHGVIDPTGDREDRTPLVVCPARRDQRAGAFSGFDDEHRRRQTRNQPVAQRKVVASGRRAGGKLREQASVLGQILGEFIVRPRAIDSAAQNRHRGTAGGKRGPVSSGVDAPRKARDDRESGSSELVCEALGLGLAVGSGRATADNADPRLVREGSQVAAHPELIGRSLDVGQFGWPARPAGAQVQRFSSRFFHARLDERRLGREPLAVSFLARARTLGLLLGSVDVAQGPHLIEGRRVGHHDVRTFEAAEFPAESLGLRELFCEAAA